MNKKTKQNNKNNKSNKTKKSAKKVVVSTKDFYTPQGQHPEDRIFKDKSFINELQKVQDLYFDALAKDLGLNEVGNDFLFDYVYNSEHDLCFDEWLERFGKNYEDCVKK